MKYFVNLSNHNSSKWSPEQLQTAEQIGKIVDIPFPNIKSTATEKEIAELSDKYVEEIKDKYYPCAVMCQGEMTFTYQMVNKLKENHIPSVAACSERKVVEKTNEKGETEKNVIFAFEGFRQYGDKPVKLSLDKEDIDKLESCMFHGDFREIEKLMDSGYDFNLIKVEDLNVDISEDFCKKNDIVINTIFVNSVNEYVYYQNVGVDCAINDLYYENPITKELECSDVDALEKLENSYIHFCDVKDDFIDTFNLIDLLSDSINQDNKDIDDQVLISEKKNPQIINYLKENYPEELLKASLRIGNYEIVSDIIKEEKVDPEKNDDIFCYLAGSKERDSDEIERLDSFLSENGFGGQKDPNVLKEAILNNNIPALIYFAYNYTYDENKLNDTFSFFYDAEKLDEVLDNCSEKTFDRAILVLKSRYPEYMKEVEKNCVDDVKDILNQSNNKETDSFNHSSDER